jgi:hypothetical protein
MKNYLIEVYQDSIRKPEKDYWWIVTANNENEAKTIGLNYICIKFNLDKDTMIVLNRSKMWKYINRETKLRLYYNNSIEQFIFPYLNEVKFTKYLSN